MNGQRLLSVLVTLGWAVANPIAAPQLPGFGPIVTQLECLAVTNVITIIEAQPSATSFCSSFLSIQTQTVVTTTTTTLPTVTSTTVTTAGTTTVTPPPVTTVVSSTSTVSSCRPAAASSQANAKRQVGLPPPLNTIASQQISQACSCLNIPTPTTTSTVTATSSPTATLTQSVTATTTAIPQTVTSTSVAVTTISGPAACPTPAQCGNNGLQYGAFRNTQGSNSDATYSTFQVAFLKSPNGVRNVIYNSTTTVPGGIASQCSGSTTTVYGSSQSIPCQFFALDHRFYLFAPVTGSYTISVSNVDDIALGWTAGIAQSGWTRANANFVAAPSRQFTGGQASYTVSLTQGQYLPIRVVYANAQAAYSFNFAIIDPFGTHIVDSTASKSASPYLVQYSCDRTSAPPFAGAFGSET